MDDTEFGFFRIVAGTDAEKVRLVSNAARGTPISAHVGFPTAVDKGRILPSDDDDVSQHFLPSATGLHRASAASRLAGGLNS